MTNETTTFEFQNTPHTTPAAACAHIVYSYMTADGKNDQQDITSWIAYRTKHHADAAEHFADECIEELNLCDQWLADRNITRADIVKAVRHFIKTRPDMVFSDEELREAERDYQNDIDAKAHREDRAYG